ncbi:MAG TPA: ferritin-like domain-containing protein [Planctomycetota bacterium]|nr:ferritin-like domain-containing protein [Planctomycetota bacterium]
MDDLVRALNACYQHELTLVVRYLNGSVQVGGLDRLHLAEFLKSSAEESMGHAEKVGAWILGLGATPQGKVTEDLGGVPDGAEKILQRALADEQTAVEAYSKAVPLAKKDTALREMLVHILKEERSGVDELKLLLRK